MAFSQALLLRSLLATRWRPLLALNTATSTSAAAGLITDSGMQPDEVCNLCRQCAAAAGASRAPRCLPHLLPCASPLIQDAVPASITGIHQETPTVKRFRLQPQGALSFISGEWVDFWAPHVPAVGGFSITSTPRQLERSGTFELAVKRSSHPAAAWLHNTVHCWVGGEAGLHSTVPSAWCISGWSVPPLS